MSKPTFHSDLIKDDGAIDDAIKKFEKLEKESVKSLRGIASEAAKLEKELVGVNTTTGQGRKQASDAAKETAKLEAAYKKYQASLGDTRLKLVQYQEATKKENQRLRAQAKLANSVEGSYNQLSARYSLIKLSLNNMSEAQRKATASGRDLEKQAKDIRKAMNEMQQATGNNSLNVGNYKESVKDALSELQQMPGATSAAAGGVSDLTEQFKIFLRNPIVAVIALIVGGLAAMGKAFFRTESGARVANKASAAYQATLSGLTKAADFAADALEDIFSDGVAQGFRNIASIIGEKLNNQLKAIPKFGAAALESLKALVTLDFDRLEKSSQAALGAIVQGVSGIDEKGQVVIAKLGEEVVDLAAAFEALGLATLERRKQNVALTKTLGELREAEGAAQIAANDSTRSAKEQLESLDELEKAQKRRLQTEIQIARNNLSTITQEIKIRQSAGEFVLDLLEQQAAAIETLGDKEAEYTFAVLEGEKIRREIRRDAFERNLDFAVDFYDAQKTQLEKQIADETRTFEERSSLLAKLQALDESAFSEQQKLLEKFTGERLAINELALIEDERIVRERLEQYRLDDVTLGRILEVLRERKAATEDIAEAERELIKQRNEADGLDGLELLGFDFGAAGRRRAAEKVAKGAAAASREARIKIRDELDKEAPEGSIYDLLGIKVGSDGREVIKTALDFAKEQLTEFAAFRTKIAEQNVRNSEREVNQAEAALQAEISNRENSSASRIESAREELEEAKKNQAEALDERRKAQRAEQRIQTAQQAVNLVTASSKIWATLGFPLALPALAVLWGSFISAKVRASQLTKQTNRKGTYVDLDFGGSHESGDDIPFGVTNNGKTLMTAERGEGMAVFTAAARRKYNLGAIVDAINRGELENRFAKVSGEGVSESVASTFVNSSYSIDMSTSEAYLRKIAQNSDRRETTDSRGRRVVVYKNQTTVYR